MNRESMKNLIAIENKKILECMERIKKIKEDYFQSEYGFKEGDKIRILYEKEEEETIGFFKRVDISDDGSMYMTLQKQNKQGDQGRGVEHIYYSRSSGIKEMKKV